MAIDIFGFEIEAIAAIGALLATSITFVVSHRSNSKSEQMRMSSDTYRKYLEEYQDLVSISSKVGLQ